MLIGSNKVRIFAYFQWPYLTQKYVFGLLCCLALTRGHGAQAGGHADGLVDDVLGPAGALRAVGQGLEAHPQLVADGPAVRVPP